MIEIPAEPADPDLLPPLLKGSKQFRLSSPTLTCPLMINGFMYPAGELANCAVTTSPSLIIRSLHQWSRSAGWCVALRIQKTRTLGSMVARRW